MAVRTDNSIVINAPLETVWQITNDVERWPSLFSEYASADIMERNGETVVFRLTTHPDENGKIWSWVSERTTDPARHSVKAHRIETGPFQFMNIEWYYEEGEGGTRMRWVQEFTMKPGAPLNDAQAEVYLNTNTQKQMALIKQRIEESYPQTKAQPGAA
jgi:aromatase